jgi:hypothetical protein
MLLLFESDDDDASKLVSCKLSILFYISISLKGGIASVKVGNYFGSYYLNFINSCYNISSNDILLAGSVTRILLIKSFAMLDTFIEGGYLNLFVFIFSYVCYTVLSSNGGLPNKRVYIITPIDQIST